MKASVTWLCGVIGFTSVALSACEPAYHRDQGVFLGDCEGYTDVRLDSNTFYISVCGGYAYLTAERYKLYRAAELSVQGGYDRFIILKDTLSREEAAKVHRVFAGKSFSTPLIIRAYKRPYPDTIRSFDAHRLLVSLDTFIKRK